MNGAAIIDANEALDIESLDNLIFFKEVILCSGIFVFCFIAIIKLLDPNNPVNKGSNGSFILIFRVAIPRNPAIRKMNNAHSFLFFSELIRNNEIAINMKGIIFWIDG